MSGSAGAVTSHRDGAAIAIWAVPGAGDTRIVGMHGGALRVRVAAAPERGRANEAIAALLRAATGADRIEITSGRRVRRKRFVAFGVTPESAVARLDAVLREHSGGGSR